MIICMGLTFFWLFGFALNAYQMDWPNAGLAGALCLLALFGWRFLAHEMELAVQFVVELEGELPDLLEGEPVEVGGVEISDETELRRFPTVVSFILASEQDQSRFVVSGQPTMMIRAGCFLTTVVWGWWALPWGPILTLKALAIILAGGVEQSVEDLAQQLSELGLDSVIEDL